MRSHAFRGFVFIASIAATASVIAGCRSAQAQSPIVINVVMKKYAIEPDTIHVKAGTPVTLHVSTLDVQHGLDIPALDISEPVNPGKPADITIKADKPGRYGIECGILCGPGHDDMTGTLIVE